MFTSRYFCPTFLFWTTFQKTKAKKLSKTDKFYLHPDKLNYSAQ